MVEDKLLQSLISTPEAPNINPTDYHAQKLSLIRWCKSELLGVDDCKGMFYHMPTSSGICANFNGRPVSEVRPFMFTEISRDQCILLQLFPNGGSFLEHFEQHFSVNPSPTIKPILHTKTNLKLLLDVHNFELDTSNGIIWFSIQSAENTFDTLISSYDLSPGLYHSIVISPR